MLNLRVDQHGSGDYCTITEALEAIPYECEAIVTVNAGVYRERLFSDKRALTIRGEGEVVIIAAAGGHDTIDAKKKRGTFRSFTAFFSGEVVTLENLTIINEADPSRGQAIALSLYSHQCHCIDVTLRSHQDTLFIGPLPEKERETDGFYGPRHLQPRRLTELLFSGGLIEGSIDFIFGSGDARFVSTEIRSVDTGWVCAPSTMDRGQGFVFERCVFTQGENVEPSSVFVMRPWRAGGRVECIACQFGRHINTALSDDWPGEGAGEGTLEHRKCTFAQGREFSKM